MKDLLAVELFATSSNWLTLWGAVLPELAKASDVKVSEMQKLKKN